MRTICTLLSECELRNCAWHYERNAHQLLTAVRPSIKISLLELFAAPNGQFSTAIILHMRVFKKQVTRNEELRIKVKQTHYVPTLRAPGVWGSQILRKSAHEGGKVVSPTHRPPLPPRKYSWYSFLIEAESNPGP